MGLNQVYRSVVLGVAGQPWLERLITTKGRPLALRFVAGETLEEALKAVEALEAEGVHSILDLLGEMVTSEEMACRFKDQILELIEAFGRLPYPRYVSLKLTQLGLDLSEELAYRHMTEILERARAAECFVRIDMEDSPRVDATLRIYRRLLEAGYTNVGTVLQAYLRRSAQDLEALLPYKPNLRIVKGAYKEPPEVAFTDKRTVDRQYLALVQRNLEAGNPTAIATHDERIIREMKRWVRERGVSEELYEFQMLYGIRRDLQQALAREGYTVRAYVPYGRDWYPYFSRRIAERPENLFFVVRGLLRG